MEDDGIHDKQQNVDSKTKNPAFSCDECNFKSHGKRSLNKHKKYAHIVYHKCDKCEHNAASDHYLKLHLQSHHKNVESEISLKNCECHRSRDRFADVSFLRTHGCAHSPKVCFAGLIFSKTKLFLRN